MAAKICVVWSNGYIAGPVNNNHWALLVVNLVRKEAVYLDPYGSFGKAIDQIGSIFVKNPKNPKRTLKTISWQSLKLLVQNVLIGPKIV